MLIIPKITLSLIGLLWLTIGASYAEEPTNSTSPSELLSPTTQPADQVKVAECNGIPVYKDEIEGELGRPEMQMLLQRLKGDSQQEKKARVTALMSIITRRLLIAAAKQSETSKNSEISTEVDRFIISQGGREKLTPLLALHKVSWEKFLGEISDGILIKKFVENEVAKNVTISDELIKTTFEKSPSSFDQPEQLKARHILFRITPDGEKDALDRAQKASEIIKKGDVSFEQYAKQHSDDKVTASKGGLLGLFSRGMMVPEFEEVAFNLGENTVSTPVKTRYGIHLIKVEARVAPVKATLENSRDRIKSILLTESRAQALNTYIRGLQEKAAINIFDSNYKLESEVPHPVPPSAGK
jgi:parvulin-like peptidyl-prolyl isomerase